MGISNLNEAAAQAFRDAAAWEQLLREYELSAQILDLNGRSFEGTEHIERNLPCPAFFDKCIFTCKALNLTVSKTVHFNGAIFKERVHIQIRSNDGASVEFRGATFEQGFDVTDLNVSSVNFAEATVNGLVKCYGDIRHPMSWPTTVFNGAVFDSPFRFKYCSFLSAQFKKTLFKNSCYFESCTFREGTSFEGARFESSSSFDDSKFHSSTSFKKAVFQIAPRFHNTDLHPGTTFSPAHEFPRLFPDIKSTDAPEAYRTLKVAMLKHHALSEEQGFFRLEMRAAAERQTAWRRAAYLLYEWSSDYGQSVRLPLVWFLSSTVGFGLIYSLLAQKGWGAWHPQLTALTLYGAVPLAAALRWTEISGQASEPLFPTGWPLLFAQIFIVVQSILSAVLLFLVGLGLRNMFKIR
jgi:hypothetical protein